MKRVVWMSLIATLAAPVWAQSPTQTPAPAPTQTQYVSERVSVPLLAAPADGPAVRTIEAGTTLTVLERRERFVRVRDRQGEAWIDGRFLSNEAPARAQLTRTVEDLNRVRTELASAQARLKKADADLAAANARGAELAKQLAAARASAPPAVPANGAGVSAKPAPAPEKPPQEAKPAAPADEGGRQSLAEAFGINPAILWLLLAFAMLVGGFYAGQRWLRESIRKRSGGMYIKL